MNCVTARDWLEYCADQGWQAGDEPCVMISYAGEDLPYLDKLRKHLDVALSRVKSDGRAFSAWDYARFRSGTALGSHFPTEVATQMWRCRAAIVLLSPDYVNSKFCFEIELPFLLWRMHHYGMRLFLLRLNSTVIDGDPFELPDYLFPTETINLMHIVDDRNPALMDRFDGHSEKMLKELDSERPDKAEARLAAYARAICDLLTLDEQRRTAPKGETIVEKASVTNEPVRHVTTPEDPLPGRLASGEPGHRRPQPDPEPRRSKVLIPIIGTLVAAALAVGGYFYYANKQAALMAEAKQACRRVAASPADPQVKAGEGVPYDKLDPAQLATCQRAADLDPTDVAVTVQTARLLEKAGRGREAFERYLTAYAHGNGLAANNIGVLYRDNSAIFSGASDQTSCATSEECDRHAVDWFSKAISLGVEAARYNLGLMLEARRGTDAAGAFACIKAQDCDVKAVDQFGMRAAIGDADAELHLGWLYLQQRGVVDRTDGFRCTSKADCDKLGVTWLGKAVAQGDPDAKTYADVLYRDRPDLKPQ
jgi:TPR repeat protein